MDEEEAPAMPPPPPPSLLQICGSLSYIFVIGFTCLGVPTVVVPRELSLFTKDAAVVMAALSVVFCIGAFLE